jgi:hypothetical protein
MNFKVYSAATTEGVSATEVKEHIRLDSSTISSNLTTVQVVLGGYHDITASLTSSGTDVLGYNSMMQFQSFVSSGGSTVTAKIQESIDNTTYTDWMGGAFTDITTANDTAVQQIEYTGSQQYIRPYVTISAAQSNFAINVIKSTPYSSEDTYIGSLITRARLYAESYQRRSLARTVYEMTLNHFPYCDSIRLPLAARNYDRFDFWLLRGHRFGTCEDCLVLRSELAFIYGKAFKCHQDTLSGRVYNFTGRY